MASPFSKSLKIATLRAVRINDGELIEIVDG
jgi:hypothetical protein